MRNLTVIVVLLFVINSSFGQVRLGLKVGANASTVSDVDGSKMRWGYNAGPVLQVNIARLFFIQPELLYSLKGFKSPTSAPWFSDPSSISLQYINLPVLFGLKAGQNLSVKLGPEIGRLISAKSDINNRDLSSYYDDFDFGADLALAFSIKKLAVDVRYNYGLKDLQHDMQYDRNGVPTGIGDFAANRALQVSLCYFIK